MTARNWQWMVCDFTNPAFCEDTRPAWKHFCPSAVLLDRNDYDQTSELWKTLGTIRLRENSLGGVGLIASVTHPGGGTSVALFSRPRLVEAKSWVEDTVKAYQRSRRQVFQPIERLRVED